MKRITDLLDAPANENDKAEKNVAFKNYASFTSYISKISSSLIDNEEDLDIVMPMQNLLEYSKNYYMTLGSLSNYYRDKIGDVDGNALNGKSFKYKTKIIGKKPRKTTTSWKSRRCKSNTTTSSTNFKC